MSTHTLFYVGIRAKSHRDNPVLFLLFITSSVYTPANLTVTFRVMFGEIGDQLLIQVPVFRIQTRNVIRDTFRQGISVHYAVIRK